MKPVKSGRRIPWLGLLLVLVIALAVVAFGLFKRKGARKPPPIPAEATGFWPIRRGHSTWCPRSREE